MKTVLVAALLSILVGAAALAQPGQPPKDAKPAAFTGQFKVLFISLGTAEGGMTSGGPNFHQALERAGIKHVYYESPGTAHGWQTWRRSPHEFVPLLFQNP